MKLKMGIEHFLPVLLICFVAFSSALAGEVTLPNTFAAHTPAVAAEVNANFTAVKNAVDDNDSRVETLEALVATLQRRLDAVDDNNSRVEALEDQVTALQRRLETLETSQVMALNSYLTVDETSDVRGPLVQLSGVNLQIVNGEGRTDTVNGLGNLIIGYDEVNEHIYFLRCSDGAYADQESCEGAEKIWYYSHKSGSHYLVAGSQNSYTQYGGIISGFRNIANRAYSTVTGGMNNTASGLYSSVSGGHFNTASGEYGSVSGGVTNKASGMYSSISGGDNNTASGNSSSVSGGDSSTAGGNTSSISGGYSNTASGMYSSVSGGHSNTASGGSGSVSGGSGNTASGGRSSVSGGDSNTASGTFSSVSGGWSIEATEGYDWAAGGLYEAGN